MLVNCHYQLRQIRSFTHYQQDTCISGDSRQYLGKVYFIVCLTLKNTEISRFEGENPKKLFRKIVAPRMAQHYGQTMLHFLIKLAPLLKSALCCLANVLSIRIWDSQVSIDFPMTSHDPVWSKWYGYCE